MRIHIKSVLNWLTEQRDSADIDLPSKEDITDMVKNPTRYTDKASNKMELYSKADNVEGYNKMDSQDIMGELHKTLVSKVPLLKYFSVSSDKNEYQNRWNLTYRKYGENFKDGEIYMKIEIFRYKVGDDFKYSLNLFGDISKIKDLNPKTELDDDIDIQYNDEDYMEELGIYQKDLSLSELAALTPDINKAMIEFDEYSTKKYKYSIFDK